MALMDLKKGDSVILCGFTGIKLGVFEVAEATEKTVTLNKSDGSQLIFSKKSGKQTNVAEGKERYANRIMENDGSFVPPRSKKKKKSKKTTKKAKIEPEVEPEVEELDTGEPSEDMEDFEDLDDDDEL